MLDQIVGQLGDDHHKGQIKKEFKPGDFTLFVFIKYTQGRFLPPASICHTDHLILLLSILATAIA